MAGTALGERAAARRALFRAATAGFLGGCLLAPSLGAAFLWVPGLGAPALLAAGLAAPKARRALGWAFLALMASAGGWALASGSLADLAARETATQALITGKKEDVVLRISSAVRMSDTGATFEGKLLAVNGQAVGPYGMRAYFPGNVRPAPGSVVSGQAELGRPEGSGGTNMARSFRVRGVDLSAYMPAPRIVPGNPGAVWEFQKGFEGVLAETYPQPARGAVAGILLGDGTLLAKDTVSDFRISGLSHMLVASGSNIVIVILALSILSRRIPGPLAPTIPAAGAILFATLAGGGVPVVRAAMMGLAASALRWGGLKIDGGHLLLAALTVFAVLDPLSLAWDPSLRLSFCATAGAMYLARPFARWLSFLPEAFGIRETVATAVAATLSTLPVTAWDFGTVSLAAVPANLLAGWAVVPTMAFGAASALFWWCPLVAGVLGFPAWVATEWIVRVAHVAASFGWASLPVGGWAGWAALAALAATAYAAREKAGGAPAEKSA